MLIDRSGNIKLVTHCYYAYVPLYHIKIVDSLNSGYSGTFLVYCELTQIAQATQTRYPNNPS
jgi:hypothetical protein